MPEQLSDSSDKALTPTVIKLGLVSFFADVSSEMLYPVTPIFLTTVLGASMTSLGLIEGVAEAVASLMKTYSGVWSDRIKNRKSFVLAGYFLAAISKPLIGFAQSWSHVLGARALDRSGKGLRSAPRDALLAESVNPKYRGEAYGWHRGMDTFGAAMGPLLAIYLMSVSGNLRNLYYWAVLPGLVAVLIVFLVKENSAPVKSKKEVIRFNVFKEWSSMNSHFKTYLISWGVFSLSNSSDVFLLMKAKSAGATLNEIILLYCGYNLIYALTSPYIGKLSDRVARKNLLIFGLIIFALVYLGFGLATELSHFVILFLIYGLYMAATDGVGKALAVDLAPAERKGTYLGVLGTVTGLATIVASTMAGLIWDSFGSLSTFLFGATGAILAIVILLVAPRFKAHT